MSVEAGLGDGLQAATPLTLSEWQRILSSHFADRQISGGEKGPIRREGGYRWLGPDQIWLEFQNDVGSLAKILRHLTESRGQKDKAGKIADSGANQGKKKSAQRRRVEDQETGLPHCVPIALGKLLALCDRVGIELQSATWKKFPALCPYCVSLTEADRIRDSDLRHVDCPRLGGSFPLFRECQCDKRGKYRSFEASRIESLHQFYDIAAPTTIDDWQKCFDAIYGKLHQEQSPQSLGYHFVEELGEVAAELRSKNLPQFEEEIADVFSWVLSLTTAITQRVGSEFKAQMLMEEYWLVRLKKRPLRS